MRPQGFENWKYGFSWKEEEILRKCFQKSIDLTAKKSLEAGMESDKIGVCVSCLLFSSNIYIPFRDIMENTLDEVLTLFLNVLDKEGPAVLLEPFEIKITGIQSNKL